jgi:hypothetical protein
MKHSKIIQIALVISVFTATSGWAAESLRAYRWTDDLGVMHYGDRVPPEYANNELAILNEQGVEVAHITGKKTDEQLAEDARQRAIRTEQIRKRDAALLRDRVLLSTYLSIDEIEALRDRRIELVEGQMRVTQIYLDNLREKLLKLERETQRFKPYSINPNAKPIDEKLARELSDTLDSIMLYEKNMSKSRTEQAELVNKFAADIDRFAQLHSLN